MMKRRAFLARSGQALGGSWVMLSLPAILATAGKARAAGGSFEVLSALEARELEAMAAQIIPSGQSPGAREAGVIHFMDAALAGVAASALAPVREGLAGLQADLREAFATGTFADLDPEDQLRVLAGIQDTPFFNTLRHLTVAGMFSDPVHGGNRGKVGWSLIGFEGPRAWQPPFGHYDARQEDSGDES